MHLAAVLPGGGRRYSHNGHLAGGEASPERHAPPGHGTGPRQGTAFGHELSLQLHSWAVIIPAISTPLRKDR
jgi:hypothetical protein